MPYTSKYIHSTQQYTRTGTYMILRGLSAFLLCDRALFADTGQLLADISTRQVPRWSITCTGEALGLIPLAADGTEPYSFTYTTSKACEALLHRSLS